MASFSIDRREPGSRYNVNLLRISGIGFLREGPVLNGRSGWFAPTRPQILSRGAAGPQSMWCWPPNAGQAPRGLVHGDQHQPCTAGLTVVLIPQERERKAQDHITILATTTPPAAFTFKNLDPGQYKSTPGEESTILAPI